MDKLAQNQGSKNVIDRLIDLKVQPKKKWLAEDEVKDAVKRFVAQNIIRELEKNPTKSVETISQEITDRLIQITNDGVEGLLSTLLSLYGKAGNA